MLNPRGWKPTNSAEWFPSYPVQGCRIDGEKGMIQATSGRGRPPERWDTPVDSTRSAPGALSAALLQELVQGLVQGLARLLLRVTFVGALLVGGWLLGSTPGMALPADGGLDSALGGGQADSAEHDSTATDTATGLAESVTSSAVSAVERQPEAGSGEPAPADRPAPAEATPPSDAESTTEDAEPTTGSAPAATPESAPSGDEPAEPVAAVTEPVAGLAEPATRAGAPLIQMAEPVTQLAEPVVTLAEPVTELAEPVVELAEPVVELAGSVTGTAEPPASHGSSIAPAATVPRAAAPIATQPPDTPSGPVLGPSAIDAATSAVSTAHHGSTTPGAVVTGPTGGTAASYIVDGLMARGLTAAAPCSSGGPSTGGSGGTPVLPGDGVLTPPADPAGALMTPPVVVAPGMLAQRPSTSPD